MSKLTSNIFGLLLLCDRDELHRRNQLLSLEKSGPENYFKGMDQQALFMDDGQWKKGRETRKIVGIGLGGRTKTIVDLEDTAWGKRELRA